MPDPKPNSQELLVAEVMARFERAKERRRPYERHWRDADRLVMLEDGFDGSDEYRPAGRTDNANAVANDTAPNAADTLASAMSSFLTNASMRWFGLRLKNQSVSLGQEEQGWLYDATTQILDYLSTTTSRFGMASDELYTQLVGYGFGAVLIREPLGGPLTFQCRDLNTLWINEDSDGNVNEVYYKTKMTVREAAKKFGKENLPPAMQDAFEDETGRQLMQEHCFIQAIFERDEYNARKMDSLNMPWASLWIAEKGKKIVRESGYRQNPYLTPRWRKRPQDPYGKGPGYKAMPGIKTVNVMDDDILTAAELQIAPPMLIPSTMKGMVRMRPRGLNYIQGSVQNRPEPLFTGGNVGISEQLLERREERIREAYMTDVLKVPMSDRMTAAEFFGRRNDGLQLLNPVIERLNLEWLAPVIMRTFGYLFKIGVIPPPPDSIAGMEMAIEYTNPMALARRANEAQSMAAFWEGAAAPLAVDGQAALNIDSDENIRLLARAHNINPRMLRKTADVNNIRATLAQQQQEQLELERAAISAGALKDAAAAQAQGPTR